MSGGTATSRAPAVVGRWGRALVVAVAAVALAALAGGCGDDDDGSGSTSTTAESAAGPGATFVEDGEVVPLSDAEEFLACVRERESAGEYTAIGPGGVAFGAYQLTQDAWNETTAHAGLTDLEGIQPNLALPEDQDRVAVALLEWKGEEPWGGSCQWPPGTGPDDPTGTSAGS